MTTDQKTATATESGPAGFSGSTVVTQMLTAFYAGDLDKLQTYLNDDIETHQSDNLPYSGRYHGIDGFTRMASTIGEHYQVENLHTRMIDSGEETVIYMDLRFTSRATGRVAETSNVEWYTFRGGKVASINIYYKDPVIVAALLD